VHDLKGRNLGDVEDVVDVKAIAARVNPRQMIDREVSERMCGSTADRGKPQTCCPKRKSAGTGHRFSLLPMPAKRSSKAFGFRPRQFFLGATRLSLRHRLSAEG
jgi:hypothetical protein